MKAVTGLIELSELDEKDPERDGRVIWLLNEA
jgi:hypothetical protein